MRKEIYVIDLKKMKKVLCFFAHPDDETLAAGGTISKLCELGIEVYVAIPATGIHSRKDVSEQDKIEGLEQLKEDCAQAMGVLGVEKDKLFLGEFADNAMDRYALLDLIHWLESIIELVKPDTVLTHHRYCTNIDHQYCHEAAIVATRPGLNEHITVLCGEVPSSTGYLRPAQWEPNFYVEISEQNLESKIHAMETYKGEARPDPHPRSREVLHALAKVRGSESGYYFAESFMIAKSFG